MRESTNDPPLASSLGLQSLFNFSFFCLFFISQHNIVFFAHPTQEKRKKEKKIVFYSS
jgi:hypothetical protein